jgi:tyrosine-protein phosphatase SIW14
MPHEQEVLIAPENFTMVEPGVYRSAFPRTKNMSFLDSLQLKSVVSLVLEDYPAPLVEFYKRNGIELMTMGVEGNKGAFKGIDLMTFLEVMRVVMNEKKRPLLIHCNKGKHRTGCVVGCLRRLRGWSVSCIVDEYMLMASPKPRLEDQRFIEAFQVEDFHLLPSLPSPSSSSPLPLKEKKKKKKKEKKNEEEERGDEEEEMQSALVLPESSPSSSPSRPSFQQLVFSIVDGGGEGSSLLL